MGRENLGFATGPPNISSALPHPKILRLLYINPARLLEKGVGALRQNVHTNLNSKSGSVQTSRAKLGRL
uniref:Uncharacterized protein n=1 Tax=Solanum lycopersicum TaxID=4081 RepID=A0A3Q7I186_SOLLC